MLKNKRTLLILTIFATIIVALLFVGCVETDPPIVHNYKMSYNGQPTPGATLSVYFDDNGNKLDVQFYSKSPYQELLTISENEVTIDQYAAVGSELLVFCEYQDVEYSTTIEVIKPKVENVDISLPQTQFYNGHSYSISVSTTPSNAIEYYDIEYQRISGDFSINGNTITIDENAEENSEIALFATINGVKSQTLKFVVSYIKPTALAFNVSEAHYIRGGSYPIGYTTTPYNANLKLVTLEITSGNQFATLSNGILSINSDATPNENVQLTLSAEGVSSKVMTVIIQRENYIELSCPDKIKIGGSADIVISAFPEDISDLAFCITKGEEIVRLDLDTLTITILEQAKENDSVTFYAHSAQNTITSNEVTVTVEKIAVSSVSITNAPTEMIFGESISLISQIMPANATYKNVSYLITQGSEFAKTDGDLLTIYQGIQQSTIKIVAVADGVLSTEVQIVLKPKGVESITLSATSLFIGAGGQLDFEITALPSNAQNIDDIALQIVLGNDFGHIEQNTLYANQTIFGEHKIVVQAKVGDIASEELEIQITDYVPLYEPYSWALVQDNPAYFQHSELALSLQFLPEDSNYTTLWIKSNVTELYLLGRKNTIYKNLFIYYENTDVSKILNLRLQDVNIEITAPISGYVFDFGECATINLSFEGQNSIKAGSPTAFHEESFAATATTNPLYGANGGNGGICIFGNSINITGTGELVLRGGNGANGTNGHDGYSQPMNSSEGGTPGGDGGIGGDSGYAIYAKHVNANLVGSLLCYAGNAGMGGNGGKGGTGGTGFSKGADGLNGQNGATVDAIYATESKSLTGEVSEQIGIVASGLPFVANTALDQRIAILSKLYYVDINYGNNAVTDDFDDYPMTALVDINKLAYMLDAQQSALNKLPKNLWREIKTLNSTPILDSKVNLNLVDTIGTSTLGLTSGTNRSWLAYRSYVVQRNQFQTTLEQTSLHEMLHLITFTINDESKIITNSTYKSMNGGYDRYAKNPNSTYVYYEDKTDGYYFMSAYARTKSMEDVSESLSLSGLLVRYYSCFNASSPIYVKVTYMAAELDKNLYNFSTFYKEVWERWL